MKSLPLYLDCTLRDGGYINDWAFSLAFAKALYKACSEAGIDFVEAGFIDPGADGSSPWTHLLPETLQALRSAHPGGAGIAALLNFGSARSIDVPPRSADTVDMIRVACHQKDAAEAAGLAAELGRKGYVTTVNFMGISNYSNQEILRLVDLMNLHADDIAYFYVADSYGSLLPSRTREIFTTLRFGTSARLGFHPHNNLQLAFANALEALECGIEIVDGSVFGMGRGAGNLFTDAVIAYFEQIDPERFNVKPLLQFADIHMAALRETWEWGYSLPQLLAGLLKCHPNYPTDLLREKSYTADAIYTMLKTLQPAERASIPKGRIEGLKRDYLLQRSATVTDHGLEALETLKEQHAGEVLIVCGGGSVAKESDAIRGYIARKNPLIVMVNHEKFIQKPHAVFFGNLRRLLQRADQLPGGALVLLGLEIEKDLAAGIEHVAQSRPSPAIMSALGGAPFLPTNSGIEAALPFLSSGFSSLTYCGLDGFDGSSNYFYEEPDAIRSEQEIEKTNAVLRAEWQTLASVAHSLGIKLHMLTRPVISFEP